MSHRSIPPSTTLSWSAGTRLLLALATCLPLWTAMAWALSGEAAP